MAGRRKLKMEKINLVNPACPVKYTPNEMRSLFHRGEVHLIGVNPAKKKRMKSLMRVCMGPAAQNLVRRRVPQ